MQLVRFVAISQKYYNNIIVKEKEENILYVKKNCFKKFFSFLFRKKRNDTQIFYDVIFFYAHLKVSVPK